MTTETVLHQDSLPHLRIVRKAYQVVAQYPTSKGAWDQPPFPNFYELMDEFVVQILEDKTNSREAIDQELVEINKRGDLDVEHGFRETELKMNLELELMNTLMAMQVAFVLNGEVKNCPIQEVW